MVGLAQLAEHQIVVLRVVGSTPTTHPIHFRLHAKLNSRALKNEWQAI